MELAEVQRLAQDLARNLEQVIVGKKREIELLLVGLLCRGHVLIEDVPGVGKTVLARGLAGVLGPVPQHHGAQPPARRGRRGRGFVC